MLTSSNIIPVIYNGLGLRNGYLYKVSGKTIDCGFRIEIDQRVMDRYLIYVLNGLRGS